MRIRLMILAVAPAAGVAALSLSGCEAVLGLGSLTDALDDALDGSSGSSTSSSRGGSSSASSKGNGSSGSSPASDAGPPPIDATAGDAALDGTVNDEAAVADSAPPDAPDVTNPVVTSCTAGGACPFQTGLNNPDSITSDGARVYWTEFGTDDGSQDGVVASCSLSGCDTDKVVYTSIALNPRGVAVDATNVYWTASTGGVSGGIFTCPIAGCGSTPPTRLATVSSPVGIQVDDTYVYFVDWDSNAVMKIPKTSTDGGVFTIYDGTGFGPYSPDLCVIGATSIFVGDDDGNVWGMPLDGGQVVQYDDGTSNYGQYGLAVDSTNLYFGQSGRIIRAPQGQVDAVVAIYTEVNWPQSFALDGPTSFLYWANWGTMTTNVNDGTVGRVLIDGGSVAVLAKSQPQPQGITVSGSAVYWVNLGPYVASGMRWGTMPSTGSIYRLDK